MYLSSIVLLHHMHLVIPVLSPCHPYIYFLFTCVLSTIVLSAIVMGIAHV